MLGIRQAIEGGVGAFSQAHLELLPSSTVVHEFESALFVLKIISEVKIQNLRNTVTLSECRALTSVNQTVVELGGPSDLQIPLL